MHTQARTKVTIQSSRSILTHTKDMTQNDANRTSCRLSGEIEMVMMMAVAVIVAIVKMQLVVC